MDQAPLPISNDDLLLRAVESGNANDVCNLLKSGNLEITLFSNDALNRSIILACYRGHAALVQSLLQDNALLEVRDDNGNTPLLICSMKGTSHIVKMLLAKGADVNAANNNGDTSLILANSREVINILHSQVGVDLNHQNFNGYTALMSAIEDLNLIKAKQLILAGVSAQSQANHPDIQLINIAGENTLQMAHRKGVGAIVEVLHSSSLLDQHPLHYCAVKGNFEICNTLMRSTLFDNSEIINIKPNILCVVFKVIKNNNFCVGKTEVELVTRLCQSGLNVNKCSDGHKSLLDIVMDIGNYDLAEVLCNYDVVISQDVIKNLVLKPTMINFIPLFAVHGGVMNQLDNNGLVVYSDSALDVALKTSQIDCAKVLLYHGAILDVKYALNQAVDSSNVKTLKFLLGGCRVEAYTIVNNNPELFHKAVQLGCLGVLKLLLEAGADIDGVYENKTPLMNAVKVDVIKYLLRKGANVNTKTNTTALINVTSRRYLDYIKSNLNVTLTDDERAEKLKIILDLLLKFGANLEGTDDSGSTALINSVNVWCHKNIMQLLLVKGSKVNQQNSNGQSALHRAARFRALDKIKILVDNGGDVNLQCSEGLTPLHLAVQNLDIMKILLKHGAYVNVQDRNGNTPLLLASNLYDDDIAVNVVSLLLESGANVNQANTDGITAVMMAAQKCNESTIIVLLNSKAEVNAVARGCPKPKSALSYLLNKWFPNWRSRSLALKLIEEGATAEYVRPDALHRIIALGNKTLLQKLIVSGVFPTDIELSKELNEWPMRTLSPLSVCLVKDDVQLAKYFIKNWYLTKFDIKILSRKETILKKGYLHQATRQYLEEVSTEPFRLELLSFVSVSTAIGSGSDREEKVKKSHLPKLLQDYLLFKNVDVDEDIGEDEEDDDDVDSKNSLWFIHDLTYKSNKEDDSAYYENDDSFDTPQFNLDYDGTSDENFLHSDSESSLEDYDEDSTSTLGDLDDDSESASENEDEDSSSIFGDLDEDGEESTLEDDDENNSISGDLDEDGEENTLEDDDENNSISGDLDEGGEENTLEDDNENNSISGDLDEDGEENTLEDDDKNSSSISGYLDENS